MIVAEINSYSIQFNNVSLKLRLGMAVVSFIFVIPHRYHNNGMHIPTVSMMMSSNGNIFRVTGP